MAKTAASTLLRRLKNVRRQLHLCTCWYIATTYQIGRFYLRTSETLQKRLKWVRLIDVPIEN